MNASLLLLLTAVLAGLAALGALGLIWRAHAIRLLWAAALLALLGAAVVLPACDVASAPATLVLPVGLPGAGFRLSLDPLAAFLALQLLLAGAAILAASAAGPDPEGAAALPLGIASAGLAGVAADAAGCAAGLIGLGLIAWALCPARRRGIAPLAVAALAAGCAAAAGAAPPDAVPWFAMLGPGALAGLVPLHSWLARAYRDGAAPAALLAGVAAPLALVLLLRLLDPAGALPPAWSALPPLALGFASALLGGWLAGRAEDFAAAAAALTIRQAGLTTLALALAIFARSQDLPSVAALALAAVLLLTVMQALCGTVLALAAGAIHHGAGTVRLDLLGGLIHRMPLTTSVLLVALIALAALPPGAGFAALWLLLQTVLGLPHAGLAGQLLRCAVVAGLGLTTALGAAAVLRLVGMACLGRPRSPRAAVADEPLRPARTALLALAGGIAAWSVLVGPLLLLLASAPVCGLAGIGLDGRATWLGIATGPESPGYAALPIALLLLVPGAILAALHRLRRLPPPSVGGPAWEDGFAAPPAWLPFGEPTTQTAGTGFVPGIALPRPSPAATFAALQAAAQRAMAALSAPALALLVVAALLALSAWSAAT